MEMIRKGRMVGNRVVDEFWWKHQGEYYIVHIGFQSDLCTFYPDRFWEACVLHDYLLHTGANRKKADKLFELAVLSLGASRFEAKIMYIGVRIGAIATKLF